MLKTNSEWIAWGRADPMFGVASWRGREKAGKQPWTASEFYALGLSDWADFRAAWVLRGPVGGTAMEVGCGAGRMTNALAETFETVVAVDVSPGMLDFARQHVAKPNIEWLETDGQHLPASDNSIDHVFSCHVFQHLPSPNAVFAQFREIHRILRPGGSLFVHLQVHAFPQINRRFARLARRLYSGHFALASINAEIRRRIGSYMHSVSIEVPDLFAELDAIGFTGTELATVRTSSNNDLHICVIAIKPSTR